MPNARIALAPPTSVAASTIVSSCCVGSGNGTSCRLERRQVSSNLRRANRQTGGTEAEVKGWRRLEKVGESWPTAGEECRRWPNAQRDAVTPSVPLSVKPSVTPSVTSTVTLV